MDQAVESSLLQRLLAKSANSSSETIAREDLLTQLQEEQEKFEDQITQARQFVETERKNNGFYDIRNSFTEREEVECRERVLAALFDTDVRRNYDTLKLTPIPLGPYKASFPTSQVIEHRAATPENKIKTTYDRDRGFRPLPLAGGIYLVADDAILIPSSLVEVKFSDWLDGLIDWKEKLPEDWRITYHESNHRWLTRQPNLAGLSYDEFVALQNRTKKTSLNAKQTEAAWESELRLREHDGSGIFAVFAECLAEGGVGDLGFIDSDPEKHILNHLTQTDPRTNFSYWRYHGKEEEAWKEMSHYAARTFLLLRALGMSTVEISESLRRMTFDVAHRTYNELWDSEKKTCPDINVLVSQQMYKQYGRLLTRDEQDKMLATEKKKVEWRGVRMQQALFQGFKAEIDGLLRSGRPLCTKAEIDSDDREQYPCYAQVLINGGEWPEQQALLHLNLNLARAHVTLEMSKQHLQNTYNQPYCIATERDGEDKITAELERVGKAEVVRRCVEALPANFILQFDLELSEIEGNPLSPPQDASSSGAPITEIKNLIVDQIRARAKTLKETHL